MSGDRAAVPDECIVPGLQGYLGYPVSVDGARKALAELGLHVVSAAERDELDQLRKRVTQLDNERDEEYTAVRELEIATTRIRALNEACLEKDDDIIRLMKERNAFNASVLKLESKLARREGKR